MNGGERPVSLTAAALGRSQPSAPVKTAKGVLFAFKSLLRSKYTLVAKALYSGVCLVKIHEQKYYVNTYYIAGKGH